MASVPADKASKIEAEPVVVTPVIEAKPEVTVVTPVVEAKPIATPVAATPKVEAKPVAKPVVVAPKIVAKAAAKPVAKAKKTTAPKAVKAKRTVTPKAAPLAAPKGLKTMTDTVKQVEETVKKATAEFSEKATEVFKDVNVRAKAAFEKAGTVAKEAAEFNKANLEAFVEAAKIAAKGAQTAAQSAAEYGRKNFEATSTLVKSAAAVKTPTELFKLQGDFARSQFDGAVAELSKSSELYLKLVGEIFQPIQSRYSVAAEELKTRLAA